MEIVEKFTESKTLRAEENEDALFISDAFIAVVDGATSKSARLFGGKSGGRAVAEEIISSLKTIDSQIAPDGAIAVLTSRVYEKIVGPTFGRRKVVGDRPNASLVVFSRARMEIWRVGDCHFAINGQVNYGWKRIDTITSEFRSAFNRALLLSGRTVSQLRERDTGREQILPLLKKQSLFMNNPHAGNLAYGVIDGNSEALKFLQVFQVPANAEVILASDGFPQVCGTLEESNSALSHIVRDDPLLIERSVQTKGVAKGRRSFDDRTYVRFRV
jgi:hypothetical protein